MEIGVSEKVIRYETYVNEVLREDLKKVHKRYEAVNSELAEYIQLKNFIQSIEDMELVENGFKTKMDLGCSFYVQANITDTSKILVSVGLGHYIELTLKEALKFVEQRINQLTLQVEKLHNDSAKTKATIKMVLGGLQQLQITNKGEKM
ncbi:hypothetical protein L9F63_026953 [Diploptera punctata]|uniref:Protein UXT n=1 Tax=Diploptera punctata TaxID=6984 RepID=A0AAD8ADR9_DIPPU|nr:hypothetical protein L9F63_026953 [Diploptera punctata]